MDTIVPIVSVGGKLCIVGLLENQHLKSIAADNYQSLTGDATFSNERPPDFSINQRRVWIHETAVVPPHLLAIDVMWFIAGTRSMAIDTPKVNGNVMCAELFDVGMRAINYLVTRGDQRLP